MTLATANYLTNTEPDPLLEKALQNYFVYQRRIHDLQRAPTREEVAEVYTEDCKMIFTGRNPIIGRMYRGIDDWLTVYEASFGIVDHVNIEDEYTEAIGSRYAFNHDSHMMVVKGDTLRFERIDIFSRDDDRINELRILEYDQFAFDDFLRKHHPMPPSKKSQWRSHTTYAPKDCDTDSGDDPGLLRDATTNFVKSMGDIDRHADLEQLLHTVVTDDAELIIQGRNPFGYGVYRGPREWSQHFRFVASASTDSQIHDRSIEALGKERAFVMDRHRLGFDDAQDDFQRLWVLRERDGKICQARVLHFDPYRFDEFVNDNI